VSIGNGRTKPLAVLEDGSPLGLARAFIKARYSDGGQKLLAHWRGEFFAFDRSAYRRIEPEELRAELYTFLEKINVIVSVRRTRRAEPFAPTSRRVSEVLDALAATAQAQDVASMPAWLDGRTTRPPVGNVIAFTNGLLDVQQFVRDGAPVMLPLTPSWFSTNCLPVRFDPAATYPRWLEFLDDVLDGDAVRIRLLREFMGYLLTQSTVLQKLLLLIGPPRSGKGTVLRVIRRVVGEANTVSCSLITLAQQFGLMPLLNKTLAISGDVHLGRGADSILVLERLKSIVGEDAQMIERKHLDALASVKLNVRFVLAANEFPRLPDASAAMRSRMLPLPFYNSYEGREDRTIDQKLAPETAGILVWALSGLRDLSQRGEFVLPDASSDLLERFARLSSPVWGFVEDCCQVGPDQEVAVDALWAAWKTWCAENGNEPGSKATFGEHLRAAVPSVVRARPRKKDERVYVYLGISLTYGGGPSGPSDSPLIA
jgi:putative DNA primase/helicase